ncbi:uncharacterized protein SPPG_03503 [Spizellomyces punctatus DAOM BR117]|uniref:Uncharacterized protein n=1 Tax=Spizellomyces punctatus (strain DAOM BR117) TaxID=645134 RepID=A0A0L0HLM5_SPIPD|nr:uncharacterized protein SPPG_03503 [Spizellomyces punctatus DAOM BR117]KND01709.1 hypothetical protein SPPG_03503 [Spizellomyces punctatus DAOM BR117]|eukprot:XP_016609748.1 hypothetical protein SPPG_03503 [Spizellomyces punctatus DAOM BR117]
MSVDESDPIAMMHYADRLIYEAQESGSEELKADIGSKALHYYISAARSGVPEAARKAAVHLWEAGQRRGAKKLLREAAQEGDLAATKILAEWLWAEDYPAVRSTSQSLEIAKREEEPEDEEGDDSDDEDVEMGHGLTPQNNIDRVTKVSKARRQAFHLWCLAADRFGDLTSMRKVAECYANGEGVGIVDMDKSIAYWERAASKDDRTAMAALARYYHQRSHETFKRRGKGPIMNSISAPHEDVALNEDGDGTAMVKLLRYTWMAASDGDIFCLRHLASAHQHGYHGAQKDVPAALQLYMAAAAQGDISARAAAADILYHGDDGVAPDRVGAFALYTQAAKEGLVPSYKALADCYRTGQGAPDDKCNLELAYMYYSEAAQQGCTTSLRMLGDLHWNGDGCVKDRAKAAEFYEQAAAAGDLEAERCLARCYWLGHGTVRDREKAKEIWREMARNCDSLGDEERRRLEIMDDEAFEELMEYC